MFSPLEALLFLVALVCVASAIGLGWRDRQGRLVPVTAQASARDARGADVGAAPAASGATLLVFTATTCSLCPAASRSVRAVAAALPGVGHREIDLTDDPAPAERYRVRQVPTTLVLDRHGRVVGRVGGVPRAAELTTFLARLNGPEAGPGAVGGEAYGLR